MLLAANVDAGDDASHSALIVHCLWMLELRLENAVEVDVAALIACYFQVGQLWDYDGFCSSLWQWAVRYADFYED